MRRDVRRIFALTVILALFAPAYAFGENEQSRDAEARKSCQIELGWRHWTTAKIDFLATSARYALCEVHDEHMTDAFLFKLDGPFITAGDPWFNGAPDLALRGGVPAAEAKELWAKFMASQHVPSPANASDRQSVREALLRYFAGEIQGVGIDGYAAVVYGTFWIEGSHEWSEVLLERFPFGWQIVDTGVAAGGILDSCVFRARGVSGASERRLQQQVGKRPLVWGTSCSYDNNTSRDVGPPSDVIAIRALEQNYKWQGILPSVRVSGDYALATWFGAGGGERLYRRDGSRWVIVTGGGGALSVEELVNDFDVPAWSACTIAPGNREQALCAKPRGQT